MSAPKIAHSLGAALVTAWSIPLSAPAPVTTAAACPDVDVTFARGTGELPGEPVCTGATYTIPTHEDMSSPAHLSYWHSGMPAQAATFVAGKL